MPSAHGFAFALRALGGNSQRGHADLSTADSHLSTPAT
jgi:hypothetical protein